MQIYNCVKEMINWIIKSFVPSIPSVLSSLTLDGLGHHQWPLFRLNCLLNIIKLGNTYAMTSERTGGHMTT